MIIIRKTSIQLITRHIQCRDWFLEKKGDPSLRFISLLTLEFLEDIVLGPLMSEMYPKQLAENRLK